MDYYRIGFNQQEITPNTPKQMAGYSGVRISEGVHDPLFVRTLVLENTKDHSLTIFASYDLLQIDSYLRDEVLKEFDEKMILVLFATHTHSGPGGTLTSGRNISKEADYGYLEVVKDKTVTAIKMSLNQLEPFEFQINEIKLEGVFSNRHDPELYFNDKLTGFKIKTPTRVAHLINFACHPTILKPNNKLFSKDLLWGIEENLETDFMMFINSTAGDVSTRFNRDSSDYDQVLKSGKEISQVINKQSADDWKQLTEVKVEPLIVELKTKTPHSKEYLEQRIIEVSRQLENEKDHLSSGEIRILETEIQGYQVELSQLDFYKKHPQWPLNLNFITWNDWTLVTLPSELFSMLAKNLLEKYPRLIFSTYTDGSNGYITDESGYDLNYYESNSSLFEKGEGEKLMALIDKRLEGEYYAT